jgi:hypothetical protein
LPAWRSPASLPSARWMIIRMPERKPASLIAGRFPGYDVLSKRRTPSWSDKTREVIARRLAVSPAPRFLHRRRIQDCRGASHENRAAAVFAIRRPSGSPRRRQAASPETGRLSPRRKCRARTRRGGAGCRL